jgi:aminoglycoside phosphotransferase (APT) family kinase protein
MEALVEPLEAHRFDVDALQAYLRPRLEGADDAMQVLQFQGGQSNPTFLLVCGGRRYVLRKKPPGKLLPSAHQVEREYRVMAALRDTPVPVPAAHLLCEDEAVIGTPFYVMDYVEGRIFADPQLADLEREQRRPVYAAMVETLAELHRVDWRAVGLADLGKPKDYLARQITRWTKQYQASCTDPLPAMESLIEWLPEHVPADDETSVVHGDFRLGNLILHPACSQVVAVLDWELCTLGHPLADLAYVCLPFHLSGGLRDVEPAAAGLPDEAELLASYCARTGRSEIPDWTFFLAFSLFRAAAIAQGVYARGLAGNASSANALEVGKLARERAQAGWRLAQQGC